MAFAKGRWEKVLSWTYSAAKTHQIRATGDDCQLSKLGLGSFVGKVWWMRCVRVGLSKQKADPVSFPNHFCQLLMLHQAGTPLLTAIAWQDLASAEYFIWHCTVRRIDTNLFVTLKGCCAFDSSPSREASIHSLAWWQIQSEASRKLGRKMMVEIYTVRGHGQTVFTLRR